MKFLQWLLAPFARYCQLLLTTRAQGFLGHVGFGKETTWGTAVAVTDYAEIMNESLRESIDRYEVKNVTGRFHEPDDVAGLHRIGGDIVLAGHPLPLGVMLKAAMNTLSGSVVLSGFLWNNRFVSTKSEFAYGVPSQPYTIEVYRDVTSSHRYAGCVLDRLVMALAPNQDLRVTTSCLGKTGTLLTRSTPTFPSSSVEPFMFDSASVHLGGSATARIEALNVTIDNQLEGVPALNNSNEIASIRRRGHQMIRVAGTMDFADVAEFMDWKNQTERALKLSLFKGQSFQFVIDIPRFIYTSYPVGISGRERQTIGFDGRARFLTSSDVAADFQLTNTKSNY
jgi:hypothetical protein